MLLSPDCGHPTTFPLSASPRIFQVPPAWREPPSLPGWDHRRASGEVCSRPRPAARHLGPPARGGGRSPPGSASHWASSSEYLEVRERERVNYQTFRPSLSVITFYEEAALLTEALWEGEVTLRQELKINLRLWINFLKLVSILTSNITFLSRETVPIKKKDMIEHSQSCLYLNILDS